MPRRITTIKPITFVFAALIGAPLSAAPADLGLTMQAPDRVIRGATVPIYSYVYNLAPAGSDTLNYSLYYTLPDSTQTTPINRTKTADGGADYNSYFYSFDSTNADYGLNTFGVRVSDPDALHSPQLQQLSVQVMDHARPAMWINGTEVNIQESLSAPEPSVDPLAFGATGGGESFAAGAPNIIGDPVHPTADLDFDSFTSVGDSQITFDLHALDDIPADDNPTSGEAWHIIVDGSVPGHYTKFLFLEFSDEDIPGANLESSVEATLFIDVTVTASGVTGTLSVLPEPSSFGLMGIALSLLLSRRRTTARPSP